MGRTETAQGQITRRVTPPDTLRATAVSKRDMRIRNLFSLHIGVTQRTKHSRERTAMLTLMLVHTVTRRTLVDKHVDDDVSHRTLCVHTVIPEHRAIDPNNPGTTIRTADRTKMVGALRMLCRNPIRRNRTRHLRVVIRQHLMRSRILRSRGRRSSRSGRR